jgi:hypothetical protein
MAGYSGLKPLDPFTSSQLFAENHASQLSVGNHASQLFVGNHACLSIFFIHRRYYHIFPMQPYSNSFVNQCVNWETLHESNVIPLQLFDRILAPIITWFLLGFSRFLRNSYLSQ